MGNKKSKNLLKMKIFGILGIIALVINHKKTPIDGEKFASILKDNGYILLEEDKDNTEIEGINQMYLASDKDGNCAFMYYKFSSVEFAKKFYDKMVDNIKEQNKGNHSGSNINAKNYSKYVFSNDKLYSVTTRVEDTIVMAEGTTDLKKDVEKVIDKLGY